MDGDRTVGRMMSSSSFRLNRQMVRRAMNSVTNPWHPGRGFAYKAKLYLAACSGLLIIATSVLYGEQNSRRELPEKEAVQVPVMVRDASGKPVSGLTSDDFILFERSQRRPVILSPDNRQAGAHALDTSILIVLAPMEASGYMDALRSIRRYLGNADQFHYQIALLDSTAHYFPFTTDVQQLQQKIASLSDKVATPQYPGGPWVPSVNKAIQELGLIPGRRIVITFTDYESKSAEAYHRNPNLLRVDPMMLVGAALRARASIYAIQTSGPSPVVPFGSAASSDQYSAAGPDLAARINSSTAYLGQMRSQLLWASSLTGGRVANDLNEAFREIVADAEGYYLIDFEPEPLHQDGGWHSIQIATRFPKLNVLGPHVFQSPLNTARIAAIPAPLLELMNAPDEKDALNIKLASWFFPSHRDVYTLAVTGNISAYTSAQPSEIQVYARLHNETLDITVGTWSEIIYKAIDAPDASGNKTFHWRDIATVFPGVYTLKLAALDRKSHVAGSRTYRFLVRSTEDQSIPVSSLVIGSDCESYEMHKEVRRPLQNPLQWKTCDLIPSSRFATNTQMKILLRLYPRDEKSAHLLTTHWNAGLVIDGIMEPLSSKILSISDGPNGTIAISGTWMPSKEGKHKAEVVLVGPKKEHVVVGQTDFTLVSRVTPPHQ